MRKQCITTTITLCKVRKNVNNMKKINWPITKCRGNYLDVSYSEIHVIGIQKELFLKRFESSKNV